MGLFANKTLTDLRSHLHFQNVRNFPYTTELFTDNQPLPKDETIALVEAYILFYNMERFQKRLGQLSPVEYRERLAA